MFKALLPAVVSCLLATHVSLPVGCTSLHPRSSPDRPNPQPTATARRTAHRSPCIAYALAAVEVALRPLTTPALESVGLSCSLALEAAEWTFCLLMASHNSNSLRRFCHGPQCPQASSHKGHGAGQLFMHRA